MVKDMVDVSTAAAIAGLVPSAIQGGRFALRLFRQSGTFDLRWIDLGGEYLLTADDVDDFEQFARNRDTRGLLGALACTLLLPESEIKTQSLSQLKDLFLNLCRIHRVTSSASWIDHAPLLWAKVEDIYSHATPTDAILADAAVEFENFLRTPLGHSAQPDGVSSEAHFVERLSNLCSDIQRVAGAMDASEQVKASLARLPMPPIITYKATDHTPTFGDLYVDRTLLDEESGVSIEGVQLGAKGGPFRTVLRGMPGAGKSTFVRYLRRLQADDAAGHPVLLVTVRNYFAVTKNQSLVEYLAQEIRSALSITMEEDQLRDVLTLGLAVVVFDGLDEITDISPRIEMVERIVAFATEYPTVSILVTTRSIGYERAPLPNTIFNTVVLDEYSAAQSREYVARWFRFVGKPDLAADFELDSATVRDLRSNPLLLSLLCILYVARGAIPRRRRDIYAQCADLLFHLWDSHRQIDQPEELHANGDRIMQEIARWVYSSAKAKGGLSERVIAKTIGGYLRDTAGVEDGEARRRASEFLDFCANRAWLLSVVGSEHGERIFGFTHRTFFEYFAAEAMSRLTRDSASNAQTLIEAYTQDATSVLPELLLQSYDERVDRGAELTFREVCMLTEDATLILRLMDVSGLPNSTRAVGFDRVLDTWIRNREMSRRTFEALLTLNTDAREQFVRDYLHGGNSAAVDLFLGGWVSLENDNSTDRYHNAWNEVVDAIARSHEPDPQSWYFDSVRAWQWSKGLAALPDLSPGMHVVQGAWRPCFGALWYGIESTMGEAPEMLVGLSALFDAVSWRSRHRSTLRANHARAFVELVVDRTEHRGVVSLVSNVRGSRGCYLYLAALIYEATEHNLAERDGIEVILPQYMRTWWSQRRLAAVEEEPSHLALPKALEALPAWASGWARGDFSFIRETAVYRDFDFEDDDWRDE